MSLIVAATGVSLWGLAFDNPMNATYTIALLALLVLQIARFLVRTGALRSTRENFHRMRDGLRSLIEQARDESGNRPRLLKTLASGPFEGLSARREAGLQPLEPPAAGEHVLDAALARNPAARVSREPGGSVWSALPGVSILLGMLGTFVGLTLALSRLPFHGDIKVLSKGLQLVLPMMGAAFWTSVCGLLASLLSRAANYLLESSAEKLEEEQEKLSGDLSGWILTVIYPAIGASETSSASLALDGIGETFEKSTSKVTERLEQLANGLKSMGTQLNDGVSQSLHGLERSHKGISAVHEKLGKAADSLGGSGDDLARLRGELNKTVEACTALVRSAEQSSGATENSVRETRQILSELKDAILRAGQSAESAARVHERLPGATAEALKLAAAPAREELSSASADLGAVMDRAVTVLANERRSWGETIAGLDQRLTSLDKLLRSSERSAAELARVATALDAIANGMERRQGPPTQTVGARDTDPLNKGIDEALRGAGEGKGR